MAAHDFAPFVMETLEDSVDSICGVSADLRIEYVNAAWTAFMLTNGAVSPAACGVGANLLLVTPEVLRPFYENLFRRAAETFEPVEHDYECSSPLEFRVFRMRIHPCRSGSFVVVHALTRSAPHEADAAVGLEVQYTNDSDMIVQCSNCRRVRRASDATGAWDWGPEFVARMPAHTSHGICAICTDFYFGELSDGDVPVVALPR